MEYEIRQVNPSSNGKTIVEESKVRRQVSGCHKKFFLSPIFTPSPFVCYLFPRRTWQCIWTNYMRRNRNIFILNLTNFFLRVGVPGRIWWSLFVHPRLKHYFPATLFFWEVFQWLGQIRQGRSGAGRCQSMQPAANFYHLCHLFYYTFFISLWVQISVTHWLYVSFHNVNINLFGCNSTEPESNLEIWAPKLVVRYICRLQGRQVYLRGNIASGAYPVNTDGPVGAGHSKTQ